MILKFINKVFSPEKQSVPHVISDIGIIYNYIQQNGEIYDEWYFQNVFTLKYWNYLKYYPWLSPEEQDYLICGCLNIILFLSNRYLEKRESFIQNHFSEINDVVNAFYPLTGTHKILYYIVKEALILVGKKINGLEYQGRRNNIYHSISWTLKNTILISSPSFVIKKE